MCFLNDNRSHLRVIAQQFAQNLYGVSLYLLAGISKLVDEYVKNDLFNLWLFCHELYQDIQCKFPIVFNVVF